MTAAFQAMRARDNTKVGDKVEQSIIGLARIGQVHSAGQLAKALGRLANPKLGADRACLLVSV